MSLFVSEYYHQATRELMCILKSSDAALILTRINWWVSKSNLGNRNIKEGVRWVYNSFTEWHKQFDWMCLSTLKNIIGKLEDMGLLIVGNFNKNKNDRTKWYTINYELLTKMELEWRDKNEHSVNIAQSIVQDLHQQYQNKPNHTQERKKSSRESNESQKPLPPVYANAPSGEAMTELGELEPQDLGAISRPRQYDGAPKPPQSPQTAYRKPLKPLPKPVESKPFDIGLHKQYEQAKKTGVGLMEAMERLMRGLSYG